MSLARTRILIIVVVALAVAIFGITRLFVASSVEAEVSRTGSLDSMTAEVTKAGWVEMDHDMTEDAPGYQMPPGMMPGMPEQGEQRMSLTITIINTSDQTRQLRAGEEFVLHSARNGQKWTPRVHTFGDLPRLAPHSGVTGTLYFDLPPEAVADSATWVEWSHGNTSTRLSVPLNGAIGGEHPHNQ
jgi:hypothetical protein